MDNRKNLKLEKKEKRKMNLKKLNLTVLLVSIIVLVPTIQIVYASPLSTFYLSGGIYPQADYTIWKEGSTYYAKNAYGLIQYSGTNASQIINSAVANGDSILLKSGYYVLDSAILIPANSETAQSTVKTIKGETLTGDAFFTKLQSAVPDGTVLASASGYTGSIFNVGYNAIANYGVRNLEIAFMTLSGLPLPNSQEGSQYLQMDVNDAGIKATNIQNVHFHHLTIINCYRGIYITTNSWTNDAVVLSHIWTGWNFYGIYITGQTQIVSGHQLFSYLNYSDGYYISAVSGDFYDIFSCADCWQNITAPRSTMNIMTKGFIRLRGVNIQNQKSGVKAGVRGIQIFISQENATISISDVVIQGVDGNGIVIKDNNLRGFIYFDRVFASPASTAYHGGEGDIDDYGIFNDTNDPLIIGVTNSVFQNCGFKGMAGNYTYIANTYNGTTFIQKYP